MNEVVHNFSVMVTLYSQCILNPVTTKLICKNLSYLYPMLQCSELRNEDLNQN